MADISETLRAKSNQLNADDVMAPITVQITAVALSPGDQPVAVSITGGHKPWMPCKTMRRLLVAAWGAETEAWVGRWVVLFRDPEVAFGGGAVGGIRVSHLSHIERGFTANLTASKGGKKKEWHVAKLTPPGADSGITVKQLQGWCTDAVKQRAWTTDQVKALLGCPAADVPADRRGSLIAVLKGPPPGSEPEAAPETEQGDDNEPPF